MSEMYYPTVALIEFIILGIGCFFYSWGGRSDKWKRRFIGSLICSTALWVGLLLMGNFSYWALTIYLLLGLGFHLGYGSSIPLVKLWKRTIIVICITLTGVVMCLILGGKAWLILPLQGFIAMGSIWLGVKNPIQAAAEEFFVCLLLTECLIMYPFVGN